MPSIPLPGSTFTFSVPLVSQADSHLFKAAATIAAGDFQRSINNGAFANMENTPTVTPTGGKLVQIVVSAAETTAAGEGGTIDIIGSDAAGAEWDDISINLRVGVIAANAAQISGDAVAADNAEAFFDGTGYAGTNNVIPTVTTLTNMPSAAPSAATVADAVWDEATSGHVAAGSTGAALSAAGAAGDPWSVVLPGAYASDEAGGIIGMLAGIDTSAVTVTASNDAGVLTIIQAVTFGATVSGLTISGTWAKIYFTLKYSDYDDDADAILQLVESNPAAGADGLLYLDGTAIVSPIVVSDGTLTVSQAGGTVAIAITDNATALLDKSSSLVWDIKTKDAAGATVQNTTGTASIVRAVTQTI